MVKGTTRRVVVVRGAQPKVFEQAIFLLREDALSEEGVTDEELLRQAREVCASSSPARFPKPLAWAALGAGTTGLAWLLTLLL